MARSVNLSRTAPSMPPAATTRALSASIRANQSTRLFGDSEICGTYRLTDPDTGELVDWTPTAEPSHPLPDGQLSYFCI